MGKKFKEKVCKNCGLWTKSHWCDEYGLWLGICEHDKIDILPYEDHRDCPYFEEK